MSIIPTLICYNFLESMLLLYAVHRFSKDKIGTKFPIKNNILKAYLLGGINFVFQYLPLLIDNPTYQFILSTISVVGMMPLMLYVFTKSNKSFIVCLLYFIMVIITNNVLISVFNYEILKYDDNLFNEFIINIVSKIFQLIFYIVLGGIYEKFYLKPNQKSKK